MPDLMDMLRTRVRRDPRLYATLARLHDDARQLVRPPPVNPLVREGVERIRAIESGVREIEARVPAALSRPVVFFMGSGHVNFLTNMAGIGLVSSWGLRVAGCPVKYFVCERGLYQCVLGANREGAYTYPPCRSCISLRRAIYPASHAEGFRTRRAEFEPLRSQCLRMPWEDLAGFSYKGYDLGRLCLPSVRWVVRRCNPEPNEFTRWILADFLASAARLVDELPGRLAAWNPQALVLCNGVHYPEATIREIAQRAGLRVVTYELGFRDGSAFFSHGIAVKYEISVPDDFALGEQENRRLDEYMDARTSGRFTMGGHRFWPEMKDTPPDLARKMESHRDVVTVFTNIGYDTSQGFCDAFFDGLFDWFQSTMAVAAEHPETLFIVRAHPDEDRAGRPSHERVADFVKEKGYLERPNVVFIPGRQFVSSYGLIRRSKFCVVYSSSIGLEAAILSAFVLPGGLTRYRSAKACYPTASREDYLGKLREILASEGPVKPPGAWVANARRFFYYSLHHASMDLSAFLDPVHLPKGCVKGFDAHDLMPDRSDALRAIREGIVNGRDFRMN